MSKPRISQNQLINQAIRLSTSLLLGLIFVSFAHAKQLRIAVATTLDSSGLLDKLTVAYQENCQCQLDAIVAGSGQSLAMAIRGDVEAAITHSPAEEKNFIKQEIGSSRREFMTNDFVIVGPATDPAKISGLQLAAAFNNILATKQKFVSRSDFSGTHHAELKLWQQLGADASEFGSWYHQTSTRMAHALLISDQLEAYLLVDRATYINYTAYQPLLVTLLTENNPPLKNIYSIILTSDSLQAKRFASWLISPEAEKVIRNHKVGQTQLFFPITEF